jgi:hypothetical protein
MQIPDDMHIPDDDMTIPFCPKCESKRFRLTDTDTVCAQRGELFVRDNVPFRPMKKGELPAEVRRLDGSPIEIPDPPVGEWDPYAGAYWDSMTGTWFEVKSMYSVEVPKDEFFHWVVRNT